MSVEYETDYEVGQDNVQVLGMDMHNPVFFISAVLILAFVISTIIFPAEAKTALDGAKGWTIDNFDWLFMVGANIFVLFCIALIFLPVGKIRLGGKGARPDFSTLSWFAMLFAAGMGIGLMFWSVAEPVGYYTDWFGTPLNVEPNTPEAKDMALGAVMYHWGLHPWAIYGVVALSLAFFAYNKGMPLPSVPPSTRFWANAAGAGPATSLMCWRCWRPSSVWPPHWVWAPNRPPVACISCSTRPTPSTCRSRSSSVLPPRR